jgi:uncharacterized surface protein with fasciclin (FAS1) repeats
MLSCDDKMDEHYKIPDWIKGSAYDVLASEGDYSIFLEGVEKAGFSTIVKGKGILTVMAPNDSAFAIYLQKKGYSSIDDIALPDLKKLIGFHLVYYAFDWDKFVNFRPEEGDGADEESKNFMAGYFYKYRTKSSDNVTVEFDSVQNMNVNVYHLERFLPVFSYKLFQTKGIDAKSNYEYFYPDSKWTGGSNGFNISNASVKNTDNVISSNGYVYFIDQVLEPLETIYTELKNNYSEYSIFFDLYNSYTNYVLESELTKNFGQGSNLYLHSHGDLPPIAYEWPVSSYSSITALSNVCYNIFAPTNIALNTFFNEYWKEGGYTTFNSLDPLVLYYFIMQSFTRTNTIIFPEEISKGIALTKFNTPIKINPENVKLRKMCANGALFGLDKMEAPAIFSSVAGPAFKYKDKRNFLYSLSGSDLLLSLASNESSFITLMPSENQFIKENMRLSTLVTGNVLQKYSDDAGTYVDLTSSEMANIVNIHVSNGQSKLPETGSKVLETNVAFNYWYIYDGRITTNVLFNQYLNPDFSGDPFVKFTEIKNGNKSWDNGSSYTYEHEGMFKADESDGLEYALAICNDARYPYYLFSQLLQKAGLVVESDITFIMKDTRFIAFIPTNEAIKKSIASIPGASSLTVTGSGALNGSVTSTNKVKLANWLRSFFITSDLNTFIGYPYPGAGIAGDFDTYGNEKLNLIDKGAGFPLSVKFKSQSKQVDVISKYHYFPFAFKDGCFHLIDDIL